MRSFKAEGIILKRSNFSEADKIVTVFSNQLGKIKVMAKGVRRIHSHRAPHLELFNHVELMLHSGKTFDTITEARVINDYPVPKADLKLAGFLFYLSEVLDKILPEHQPHPELFSILIATLNSLSHSGEERNDDSRISNKISDSGHGQNDGEQIVKKFIVKLLWNLGYLPKDEYPKAGITDFVEEIVEKRINSRKFLEEI